VLDRQSSELCVRDEIAAQIDVADQLAEDYSCTLAGKQPKQADRRTARG
jgi:hypothetical protein